MYLATLVPTLKWLSIPTWTTLFVFFFSSYKMVQNFCRGHTPAAYYLGQCTVVFFTENCLIRKKIKCSRALKKGRIFSSQT